LGLSVATHLIDKSAWVRLFDSGVDAKWPAKLASGGLAITGISMIEVLVGSRNTPEFQQDRRDLDALPRRAVTEQIIDRALEVQGLMVARGTHRAPSPADLILAACAEESGLTVLHYDKDFELIAEASGQPTEWLAPAGTLR
jgi:predicted nucleic acid-binding protein